MTSIVLVRHAHALWSTDETRSLSRRGQLDARRLAVRLAGLPVTGIYSSPYTRSLETVQPLASRLDLPVRELSDLRERSLGSFNAGSFDEAVAATWADFDFAHEGGESSGQARRRGLDAVRFLAARHRDEVIVAGTHGNLLALILSAFDARIDFDFWRALEFPDAWRLDLERSGEAAYHRVDPVRADR